MLKGFKKLPTGLKKLCGWFKGRWVWFFSSRDDGLEAPFGVIVPPLALGLVMVWATYYFSEQASAREAAAQTAEAEAEFVRNLTIGNSGEHEVKLVTALGRLVVHLRRIAALMESEPPKDSMANARQGWLAKRDFEEAAAFFFYAKFRAETVDFGTKERLVFSSQWLEDMFMQTVIDVGNQLAGGAEEDLDVPLEDESAVYWYFGGQKLPYLLPTVDLLLTTTPPATDVREILALRRAYERFREQVREKKIDVDRVELGHRAMYAVVKYSTRSLLPKRYGSWVGVPDAEMPTAMPDGFRRLLFYYSDAGVKKVWEYLQERVAGARRDQMRAR